jgi:multisubunit Na+/H+ antiporter MnhG subunit
MKPEDVYERLQSADRMDAVMVITSAIGTIAAILALLTHGWLAGLGLFLLSMIAFAMSRVFDLLADLLKSVGSLEESKKPNRSVKGDDAAS